MVVLICQPKMGTGKRNGPKLVSRRRFAATMWKARAESCQLSFVESWLLGFELEMSLLEMFSQSFQKH